MQGGRGGAAARGVPDAAGHYARRLAHRRLARLHALARCQGVHSNPKYKLYYHTPIRLHAWLAAKVCN